MGHWGKRHSLPFGWAERYERLQLRLGQLLQKEELATCCAYCGRTDGKLTLEHVVPRARHGPSTEENTVLACRRCNERKGKMSAGDFIVRYQLFDAPILRSRRFSYLRAQIHGSRVGSDR